MQLRKKCLQFEKEIKVKDTEITALKRKIDQSRVEKLAESISTHNSSIKAIKTKLEQNFSSSNEKERKILELSEFQVKFQRQQALYLGLETNFNQVLADKRLLEEENQRLRLVAEESKQLIAKQKKDLQLRPEPKKTVTVDSAKLKEEIKILKLDLRLSFKKPKGGENNRN